MEERKYTTLIVRENSHLDGFCTISAKDFQLIWGLRFSFKFTSFVVFDAHKRLPMEAKVLLESYSKKGTIKEKNY